MALPIDANTQQPKPLKITVDMDTMLADEECLFWPGGFNAPEFRDFLREHSNYSAEELHQITRKELRELYQQAAPQVFDAILPKAK